MTWMRGADGGILAADPFDVADRPVLGLDNQAGMFDPGTCPNCGDASRVPCINCYTYGAHGGPCHHHPALDERSIGRCNRNRCEVTA